MLYAEEPLIFGVLSFVKHKILRRSYRWSCELYHTIYYYIPIKSKKGERLKGSICHMNNRVSVIVATIAMVGALSSSFTAFAAENANISTSIESTAVEATANEEVASSEVDAPVLAIATASTENAEMEAQVILGDGTFKSSDRVAIEEDKDYTFVISGLAMGKEDFGNVVLTFDFAGSKLLGEDIEDINLDITELKIDEVSFDVSNAHYTKEQYDGGFNLFDIIRADAEAYANAFYENGDTSGASVKVDKIAVGIHVNTLKVESEEETTTTTSTTTTVTETTTTTTTTSTEADVTTTTEQPTTTTQAVNTTTSSSTTKATTTTKSTTTITTTTTKPGSGVNPPDTGDAGVGMAIAMLGTTAALALVARKREK